MVFICCLVDLPELILALSDCSCCSLSRLELLVGLSQGNLVQNLAIFGWYHSIATLCPKWQKLPMFLIMSCNLEMTDFTITYHPYPFSCPFLHKVRGRGRSEYNLVPTSDSWTKSHVCVTLRTCREPWALTGLLLVGFPHITHHQVSAGERSLDSLRCIFVLSFVSALLACSD